MKPARNVCRALHGWRSVAKTITNTPQSKCSSLPLQTRLTSQQVRHATTYSTPYGRLRQAVFKAQTEHPVLFPVSLIAAMASVSVLAMLMYDEYTRVGPQFAAYPSEVEQRLRLALHFTHVNPDPATASEAFLEAIKAADACGMDPFGKESMGIRIRYSEMLEKFGHVKASVEVLDSITKDCEDRLAEVDSIPKSETGENIINLRRVLLRFIIQTRVKASSLYESDYIQDTATAKQVLSDAVGLLVKETKDPQTNGFSEENAAGLSMAEIASVLSQMADLYATTGEEANAVQVYMLTLQPLRLACNGTRSCKEVQVLGNIASTMAIAMKKPNAKVNGKPVTKESLAAARKAALKWADQAIGTADVVLPEHRDEVCELGLLSAQMTRADLLLESGDKVKSKEIFVSLLPSLRGKGLTGLIEVAEQGLKRIDT